MASFGTFFAVFARVFCRQTSTRFLFKWTNRPRTPSITHTLQVLTNRVAFWEVFKTLGTFITFFTLYFGKFFVTKKNKKIFKLKRKKYFQHSLNLGRQLHRPFLEHEPKLVRGSQWQFLHFPWRSRDPSGQISQDLPDAPFLHSEHQNDLLK